MPRNKNPGRIRERLAALLLVKGIIVAPYDLWVQEGGYRHAHWDLARWGANNAKFVNGIAPDGKSCSYNLNLCSWDTMTECVKWGIEFASCERDGSWGTVEVSQARKPNQTKPTRRAKAKA